MLQINGGNLYMGIDNSTNGVGVFKATAAVTGTGSFTQQSANGLGNSTVFKYIFSSASQAKQGKNYIYVTVGDDVGAIQVVRQVD